MIKDTTILRLYGVYVYPGVAKSMDVIKSFVSIDSLREAMENNKLVFLQTYEMVNDLDEENHDIGTMVRILNIWETEHHYSITVLGVNRAKLTHFNAGGKSTLSWTRQDYKIEPIDQLKKQYDRTLQLLNQFALFMDSLSAHRTYEHFRKMPVDDLERFFELTRIFNKFIMEVLDITDAYPTEYQAYLEINQLTQALEKLHKRLYTIMVEAYNQRYHFPEYVDEIPEADLPAGVLTSPEDDQLDFDEPLTNEAIQEKIEAEGLDPVEALELEMIEKGIPQTTLHILQSDIHLLKQEDPSSKSRLNGLKYLQTIANLPWAFEREASTIKEAKAIMDSSHFGMDEAKTEISKFLAERALNKDAAGAVLCLAGPPGVGKTSLVKTIAKATNREFIQIKLGGVSDEAIIRGFPKTYTGSSPGVFIQEMEQVNSINPVILLDEVDKINTQSNRGDVSAALLEVLDPSQNKEFRDHYLGIPYDLSNCLFIATANYLEEIPHALKDRMEVIHLKGYSREEKLTIVQQYVLSPILKDGWLKDYAIEIDEAALLKLIDQFEGEAGVRSLERAILGLCREIALRIMVEEEDTFHIRAENITDFIPFNQEQSLEAVKQSIGFLREEN